MPTIAVVNSKGGVGKTTTSIGLALAAGKTGRRANVVDLDQQGSSWAWHNDIISEGIEPTFDCQIGNVPSLKGLNAAMLNIIDTPPGDPTAIDAAVKAADFVILPAKASLTDFKRLWATLEVTSIKPTAVLQTMVDLRTNLHREVRKTLEAEDIAMFQTLVIAKEEWNKLSGTVPRRLYGYDDVFAELMEVL